MVRLFFFFFLNNISTKDFRGQINSHRDNFYLLIARFRCRLDTSGSLNSKILIDHTLKIIDSQKKKIKKIKLIPSHLYVISTPLSAW